MFPTLAPVERWKIILAGLAIALAGAFAGYVPTLVKDLIFLHDARVLAELQQKAQQQPQPPPQPPAGPTAHQIAPDAVKPAPTSSPPEKK